MRSCWITCNDCGHEYVADFSPQGYAADSAGENCIECGSNNLEHGEEAKRSSKMDSAFWIVLLIPNFLIFWS